MSYTVEWSRHALADLQSIRDHIGADNPRAARLLAAKLLMLADTLAVMPHRGRVVAGATQARELVLGKYLLRYRVTGQTVLVVRVKHSATRA